MARKKCLDSTSNLPQVLPRCEKCGSEMIATRRWLTLSLDERNRLLDAGFRRNGALGRCQTCYGYGRRHREAMVKHIKGPLTRQQVATLRAAIGWTKEWMFWALAVTVESEEVKV